MTTRTPSTFALVVSLLGLLAHSSQAQSDLIAHGGIPAHLDPDDWAEIRSNFDAERYAVLTAGSVHRAFNARQQWSARFESGVLLVQPNDGSWTWGLALESFGFENECIELSQPLAASTKRNRLTYRWSDTLDEWYVNEAAGIKHGYTIRTRPQRGPAGESARLTLQLRVLGNLTAKEQIEGSELRFLNEKRLSKVTYSGLTVLDADDKILPARFELNDGRIILSIDERHARYPLTVDPIVHQTYLPPASHHAQFGYALAAWDDTVLVGAPAERSNASGVNGNENGGQRSWSGAAFVYVRTGNAWTKQAYLKASHPGIDDRFGISVSGQGDTIVIGAPGERSSSGLDPADNTTRESGAAYVFSRTGTVWNQSAYLKASSPDRYDHFGQAVKISGNSILIGAPEEAGGATGVNGNENDNSAPLSGAGYVFVRNGTTWNQQAYLKAGTTEQTRSFGAAVDISDDMVVIGTPREFSNARGIDGTYIPTLSRTLFSGAAYIFERNGVTWSQSAYLKASNTAQSILPEQSWYSFGQSVAVSNDTVVIGSPGEPSNATGPNSNQNDTSAPFAGAVYVFARNGTGWIQQTYLKASNAEAGDQFGIVVAVAGDTILALATGEKSAAVGVGGDQQDNSQDRAGAAYLFSRNGTAWSQQAYIKAPAGNQISLGHNLAGATAMTSSTLVVGGGRSPFLGGFSPETVFVFDLNASLPIGRSVCSGDGGNQQGCTDCPCANNAQPGALGGCLNSTGTSAHLVAEGDTSVSLPSSSTTDLSFKLHGIPPTTFCILTSGDAVPPSAPSNPCFGLESGIQSSSFDGLRCSVGNVRRHGGRLSDVFGGAGELDDEWGGSGRPTSGIARANGGFVAGQTRYFQAINRDDPLLGCMRGLNASQAIEITFTP